MLDMMVIGAATTKFQYVGAYGTLKLWRHLFFIFCLKHESYNKNYEH